MLRPFWRHEDTKAETYGFNPRPEGSTSSHDDFHMTSLDGMLSDTQKALLVVIAAFGSRREVPVDAHLRTLKPACGIYWSARKMIVPAVETCPEHLFTRYLCCWGQH